VLLIYSLCKQYHLGKIETDPKKIDSLRTIAHSYTRMVSDIRELKRLRFLDTGEKLDQRDKIRYTAHRVGLHVPRVSSSFHCIFCFWPYFFLLFLVC
jgi:hypothetical protein